uniref:Uncharacterized protein n=1 Tax=Amphimedon queenslandica TaxID=400682 RepID=A0A1X7UCC0_AMPQE
LGEILSCEVEPGNIFDPYAVAIKRSCNYGDNNTVGHVLRKISVVCCLVLKRGTINYTVTGARNHTTDLIQGGLEVPCTLTVTGMKQDIEKVKQLLERAP